MTMMGEGHDLEEHDGGRTEMGKAIPMMTVVSLIRQGCKSRSENELILVR
jgi:hypothetical protein